MKLTHGECYNCGWIGPLMATLDHPDRPMADDMFCPQCRVCEIDHWITEEEAAAKLAEYE